MSFLINNAYADVAGAAPSQAASPWPLLVTMGIVFLVMYVMTIRPQQKRQKQVQEMLEALSKGDEVVFAGGLMGKITRLSEDYVSVEVAAGLELKVQRSSIQAVLPKGTIKQA